MKEKITKVSVIGLALVLVALLIFITNMFTTKSDTIKSALDSTKEAFAVNLRNKNIGTTEYRNYNDLYNNPNLYCIAHGKELYSTNTTYTVKNKNSINGFKTITKTERNTETDNLEKTNISKELEYKYNASLLYLMSQTDPNAKYENNYNQQAVWVVMTYYYEESSTKIGYKSDYYKLSEPTLDKERVIKPAKEAIAFAEYMWDYKQNGFYSEDEEATWVKDVSAGKCIVGPFKMVFPEGKYKGIDFSAKLTKETGIEHIICDKDGNEIGIKSGEEFYLKVKRDDITNKDKTITFNFTRKSLTGEYYYLKANPTTNQDLIEGEGSLVDVTKDLKIELPRLGEGDKYKSATFSLSLQKVDSKNTEKVLDGSKFKYTTSLNTNEQEIEVKDGNFEFNEPFIISCGDYDVLSKNNKKVFETKEYPVFEVKLSEVTSPDGYKQAEGDVTIELYLDKEEKTYTDGEGDRITKHQVVIKKFKIINNLNNNIIIGQAKGNNGAHSKIVNNTQGYDIIEAGKTIKRSLYKDEGNTETTSATSLKLEEFAIGNTAMYSVSLDKLFNKKKIEDLEAEFKIKIGDKNNDINYMERNVSTKTGLLTSGGSTLSGASIDIKKDQEDDKIKIYLIPNNGFNGVIYIEIEEINAPSGYAKLPEKIRIELTVENGIITNAQHISNNNKLDEEVTSASSKKTSITVNNKTILSGSDSFKITKYGESTILPGVKFNVKDLSKNTDEVLITDTNGTIQVNIDYNSTENKPSGTTLNKKQYEITEIETVDGYIKLGENEKILVDVYPVVIGNTIKTAAMIIENKTNSGISCVGNSAFGITPENPKIMFYHREWVNNSEIDINNIKSENAIEDSNVHENSADNNLTLFIHNRKVEKEGEYKFTINKHDSINKDNKLQGVNFAVLNEEQYSKYSSGTTGYSYIDTQTTGSIGEATFTIPLTKEGKANYYLIETSTIDGYQLFNKSENIKICLDVVYDTERNELKVNEANFKNNLNNSSIDINGRELKASKQEANGEICDLTVSEGIAVNIQIPNNIIKTGQYSIKINKKNKDENPINGAVFNIQSDNGLNDTLTIGTYTKIEEITESVYENETIYYHIKETGAPEGYKLLNGQIDVKVSFTEETTGYTATMQVTNNTDGKIKVGDKEIAKGVTENVESSSIELDVYNDKEDKIDLALKKFIAGVSDSVTNAGTYIKDDNHTNDSINGYTNYTKTQNREATYNTNSLKTTTEATYTADKTKPVEVKTGDIVTYGIRIYNEGQTDGYASLIKDHLPNGVRLVEASKSATNQEYGWTSDGSVIQTRYLENKKLSAYAGGNTLNYATLYVDLEVTEPDSYTGTLTNVAEIAEMKDKDNNVIEKDVDSTTKGTVIDRSGETITDYNPKEDDIDYEWIKLKSTITISGRVWLDEIGKDSRDNILGDGEGYSKIDNGVTAQLYNAETNTQVGNDVTVNADGTYQFTNVPKYYNGQLAKYKVKFVYDGMDYEIVTPNVGNDVTKNSKVTVEENRGDINSRYGTINKGTDITYTVTQDSASKTQESKYQYNPSTMSVIGSTDTIILNQDTKTVENINLGLKERPKLDLALYKEPTSATITINGQTETYNYDRFASFDFTTGKFADFIVKLRNGDFNSSLPIRDTDRGSVSEVYTTYKLTVRNNSSVFSEVTKVKDLYDTDNYEVRRVYVGNTDLSYTNVNGEIRFDMPSHVIGNNETTEVYIDLKLKQDTALTYITSDNNHQLGLLNHAEICEYKTYTNKNKTSTPGIIDYNSAPDNYNKGDEYLENDTGKTPVIYIGTRDTGVRTLSGNVFEDINPRINITGVTVQLVEITQNGEEVRDTQYTADGNYTFTGFLPGIYKVKFTYGDRNETVLTNGTDTLYPNNGGSNGHSYNGQDYASTEYDASKYENNIYWYKDVTDKSDAVDDSSRRTVVNNYSKTYTNSIAEILNSWKIDSNSLSNEDLEKWESKINTLKDNTYMYANTAPMTLSVEYAKVETSNGVEDYNVSGIDFGLEKRSTSEVELEKHVTKLTLKSSSGETLVEATPERNGSSVQWMQSKLNMPNGIVKIEQEDAVLNGANIEIEYTLTAKNTGDITTKVLKVVDYIDNNLRFDETANSDWQVVQASDLKTLVAEKDQNGDDIDLSKRQVIVVTKNTNPLVKDAITAGGESGKSTITLTKTLSTSNTGDDDFAYNNIAEILALYNEEGRKTEEGTPGNLNPEGETIEKGEAKAEPVTISNPTGQSRVYYVLGITIAVIMAAGVIAIKKFVIDKK